MAELKDVNIPSTQSDPNYRYKMPKLVAKVEGRGNGIKTNIMNMGDISKALKRSPEYCTRFCGCELGASSKFDPSAGTAIVNGCHDQRTLQGIMDKFIAGFVLCSQCKLPEVDLYVKKQRVQGRCNACGANVEFDNAHKLATYIQRNPPETKNSTIGKHRVHVDEDHDIRKSRKDKPVRSQENKESDSERELKEEKEKNDKKEKKEKKKKKKDEEGGEEVGKKKKKSKDKEVAVGDDEDAEALEGKKKKKSKEEKDDNREEAKESKKKSKEEKEESLYRSEECEEVTTRLREICDREITQQELYAQAKNVLVSQGFPEAVKVFVIIGAVFHTSFNPENLKSKLDLFPRFIASARYQDLCTAMEWHFNIRENCNVKHYPYILKILYDENYLEEEDILQHYASVKGTRAYLDAKAAAEPFLNWLRSVPEESDDEESEERQVPSKESDLTEDCDNSDEA